MIAGTASGSGKTTFTLGLMAALKARNIDVRPFKCGPDFIDPTLHKAVTGRDSFNLDPLMCGKDRVRKCFSMNSDISGISVVEGVMGLFDGGESSSASIARLLGIPVILVVDARSAAESIAAVIKGFETFDDNLDLKGIILNRIGSQRHLDIMAGVIEKHCRTVMAGALPRNEELVIPERHLGLRMAHENVLTPETVMKMADFVEKHAGCDRIIKIARESSALKESEEQPLKQKSVRKVRIAVASDMAFCFYYRDNIDLLEAAGAEIIMFSPVSDSRIPDGISGIYLGGGYPELFAGELSRNHSMLSEIRKWSESGRPIYAECGGFLYLTEGIEDSDGRFHKMAGVYPVRSRMGRRLAALGYRKAILNTSTVLGKAGTEVRGHEFHYSSADPMPDHVARAYSMGNGHSEGFLVRNTLAGYIHLHFGICPEIAENFVNFCMENQHGHYA